MLSKLVCKLFGHQPLTTSGWQGGTGYAEALGSAIDGVGTLHLHLYAECPRCREVYPVCNAHVPARIRDEDRARTLEEIEAKAAAHRAGKGR